MNTTVITALYDIGRDLKGDGRTIDQYLNWFEKTLNLNVPMVVYTEEKFKNFVLNKKHTNLKLIVKPLNEIPYYKYKNNIDTVLTDPIYYKKIKDPHRVECILSLYNIIQYSKFEWIREAIDENYFNTDYYFWMDAGCSRFFDNIDVNTIWPNNYSILDKNKFNIQGNNNTINYFIEDVENYIWDSNCILVGTLFGGTKEICIKMAELVNDEFNHYLSKNIINNEQIILGILYKKYPQMFNLYIELNGKHLPFFNKLS